MLLTPGSFSSSSLNCITVMKPRSNAVMARFRSSVADANATWKNRSVSAVGSSATSLSDVAANTDSGAPDLAREAEPSVLREGGGDSIQLYDEDAVRLPDAERAEVLRRSTVNRSLEEEGPFQRSP